jgi:hypothetical protein
VRTLRSIAALLGLCTLVGACTTLSPSKERASEVYVTIVEWFAAQSRADPPLRVFVEPRGEGSSISVDVQADVITAVEEVASVRFIDARDEALEDLGDEVVVVRDNGILLALDPVPKDKAALVVEVDEYLDGSRVRTHRFEMSRRNDRWQVDKHTFLDGVIMVAEP